MSQQLTPGQPINFGQGQQRTQGSSDDDMFVSTDDGFSQGAAQVQQTTVQPIKQTKQRTKVSPMFVDKSSQHTPNISTPVGDSISDISDDDDFDDPFPPIYPTPTRVQQSQGTMQTMSSFTRLPTDPQQMSLSKMTEDQRKEVISRVFRLVLGREPIEKDFNYYRFSLFTEDGLIRNILNLPEHKGLVDQAKQFGAVKMSQKDLEIRVKYLESHLVSVQAELTTLRQILNEKNRYIQNLRASLQALSSSDPASLYSVPVEVQPKPAPFVPVQYKMPPQVVQVAEPEIQVQTEAPIVETAQQVAPVTQQNDAQSVTKSKLPSPVDELKSLFSKILTGK